MDSGNFVRDALQAGWRFGFIGSSDMHYLSHIDQAGAVGARRHGCRRVVTVAMDKVEFHEPVRVGDAVSYYTELVRKGRTSITVEVCVEAERLDSGERVPVTSATVTYVNVDAAGRPKPF